MNGDRRVSQPAREAVEAAVRSLGYVPNRAARSLVTRRSDSVAVVIPEPSAQLFGDPFFPRVLRGISDALAEESMQLVLLMPQGATDEDRVERYLGGRPHRRRDAHLRSTAPTRCPPACAGHGVPLVVGGRPRSTGVTYVDVDNRAGAADAVQHLAEAGRRRIATIAGPQDMAAGVDRLPGYHDAAGGGGDRPDAGMVEIADFTHDGGRAAMERLLERASEPRRRLRGLGPHGRRRDGRAASAGRSIPDDVAVVGFDDSPLAADDASRPSRAFGSRSRRWAAR